MLPLDLLQPLDQLAPQLQAKAGPGLTSDDEFACPVVIAKVTAR